MTNVGGIQGPSPLNPMDKKDKASSDAEKFKELMKVQKVDEIDPEEKKKRKHKEEDDEDLLVEEPAPVPPPQLPISNQDKESKVGLNIKAGDKEAFFSPSSSQGNHVTFSSQEAQEDEWQEDSDRENVSEEAGQKQSLPPSSSSQVEGQSEEQPPSSQVAPDENVSTFQASEENQEQSSSSSSDSKRKDGHSSKSQEALKTAGLSLSSLEKEIQRRESKEAFFEQYKKNPKEIQILTSTTKDSSQVLKKDEEKKLEADSETLPEDSSSAVSSSLAPIDLIKKENSHEKNKEDKMIDEVLQQSDQALLSTTIPPVDTSTATSPPIAPYSRLDLQTFDLFQRMVGVMTIATTRGVNETTINLNAPQFASSIFYGAQITITEFSTAPKAFNVQLTGTPQAIERFQENANDLLAAFEKGNYTFKVNRLETRLFSIDKPLFKRKERANGNDSEDQPQDA